MKIIKWLGNWWWLVSIIGTLLYSAYTVMEENINMKRDIIDLKSKMEDQLKKQLSEKDVEILIQLNLTDTKENIRNLQNILMHR